MQNNPIRFNDPTGHYCVGDDDDCVQGEGGTGPACYPGELVCQLAKDSNNKNHKPKNNIITDVIELASPPTLVPDTSSLSGPTVLDYAMNGDYYAIARLFMPTHAGIRLQGEFSLSVEGIGGWSPAGSLGVNYVHNFVSGENDSNIDFTLELYSAGLLSGGSVTGGPLIGWGSSNIKDVTAGKSQIYGGTIAGGPAISASVVAPMSNTGNKLHIDPIYGIVPTTIYIGGGAGAGYAGVGAGKSKTIYP